MAKNDWDCLIHLLLEAKNADTLDDLLHLFLTITEREFLLDRFRIIKELLMSEHTQREIAQQLGVSIAKITVGSNELKKTDPHLKQLILKALKKC